MFEKEKSKKISESEVEIIEEKPKLNLERGSIRLTPEEIARAKKIKELRKKLVLAKGEKIAEELSGKFIKEHEALLSEEETEKDK